MANVLTEPADFSQEVVAYWINSPISDEVAQVIAEQQAALIERFDDAIWNVPHESLHISFNALSPFYFADGISGAPSEVSQKYIEALAELLEDQKPIELHFDTIEVSPASIILKARLRRLGRLHLLLFFQLAARALRSWSNGRLRIRIDP